MTSASTDDDEKIAPGRIVAAIIFALLALAFFGITVYYLVSSHHSLRGVGSFVLGLAFVGSSWFVLRYRSLALEEAREADRAAALAEAPSATGLDSDTGSDSTVQPDTEHAATVQAGTAQSAEA